jgi:chemotaxis signal transduction protein
VPDLGTQGQAHYINGIARANDKLVVLLDIERVMASVETKELGAAA